MASFMKHVTAVFTAVIIMCFTAGISQAQCPAIVVNSPFQFSNNNPTSQSVVVVFSTPLDPNTVDSTTFVVHGNMLGYRKTAISLSGTNDAIFLNPTTPMLPGERVTVLLDSGIEAAGGCAMGTDFMFQYNTIGGNGPASFENSNQSLSNRSVSNVRLADYDLDGDLDAFIVAEPGPHEVWLNNGSGVFTNSGQVLGDTAAATYAMDVADIDADGDMDVVTGDRPGDLEVFKNNGSGVFTSTGQSFGSSGHGGLALGDLDGDGDMDMFVGRENLQEQIYFNDGTGTFTLHQSLTTNSGGTWVALGDLDTDRDLDAIVADRFSTSMKVYRNDGSGNFTTWQTLAIGFASISVELGDLDSDGDLDVLVGNSGGSEVWFNNGVGGLSISPSLFGDGRAVLGDIDGDADLDVIQGGTASTQIWLNNGLGSFSSSGQDLGVRGRIFNWTGVGDLDGDQDLDLYITRQITNADSVWLNQTPCSPPGFTLQPNNVTACEADTHRAMGTATSGGRDSIRWHISTNGGASWLPLYDDNTYTGTDYDSLFFLDITVGMQNYEFRAVNYACGGQADSSNVATLSVNPLPSTAFTISDSSACKNVQLNFFGPSGSYFYYWEFGDGDIDTFQNVSHSYSTTGQYAVVLWTTDQGTYCETNDTQFVNIGEVSIDSVTTTPPKCNGDSSGAIMMHVSGISPFTYSLDSGLTYQPSDTFNNVSSGVYYVVANDSVGCRTLDTVTITDPPTYNITLNVTAFDCNGDSTGSVDQSVSGGTPPYSYLWSNGDTTEDVSTLPGGWHTTTVTDSKGCKQSDSVQVLESTLEVTTIANHITCKNADDASIDLSTVGGVGNLNYQWSNGPTTEDVSNLPAGQYTYVVTDSSACADSGVVTIPVAATLPTPTTNDTAACGPEVLEFEAGSFSLDFDGFDDGVVIDNDTVSTLSDALTVEAWISPNSGGSGWRPLVIKSDGAGAGYKLYRDQVAGNIIWTISDSSDTDTLISQATVSASAWAHVAASYSDGQFKIYINGAQDTSANTSITPETANDTIWIGKGGGSFLYSGMMDEVRMWSEDRMAFGLDGDKSHMLTGTEDKLIGYWRFDDGKGSLFATDATTNSLDAFLVLMSPSTDWVSGDPFGIQYKWYFGDGDSSSSSSATHSYDPSFAPGVQVDLVREFAGSCVDSTAMNIEIIPRPDPIIVSDEPLVVCLNDTIILTSMAGEAGNVWSTGSNADFIYVDTSGTYIVDATDSLGCTFSDTVMVTYEASPDPNPIVMPSGLLKACDGEKITLDAGSGYFAYEWNTGDTTQTLLVDSAGKYCVLVTNGFGCAEHSDSVEIQSTVSNPASITQVGDTLYASAGVSYQWFLFSAPISGATNSWYAPTAEGLYKVSIVDSNGCDSQDTIEFKFTVGLNELVSEQFQVYPNPTDSEVRIDLPVGVQLDHIRLQDQFGRLLLEVDPDHAASIDMRPYPAGVYFLSVHSTEGWTLCRKVVRQ